MWEELRAKNNRFSEGRDTAHQNLLTKIICSDLDDSKN